MDPSLNGSKLTTENIIQGYEVRIDPRALDKPLLAFVFVTDAKPSQGFDTAAGTDELNAIIEQQINPVQSVTRVRTTIVLRSVAEKACLSGHDLRAETTG